MRLTVEINTEQLEGLLKKLESATNTTAILDEAGAVILNRIRTRFLKEMDPEEVRWEPSQAAIDRRAEGGTGTLFDTGTLFRSIQLAGTGPDERKIMTDVEYGKYHQYGTKFLPVREFMGFNKADAELIERLVVNRVQKALQ